MKTRSSNKLSTFAKHLSLFTVFLVILAGCSNKIQGSGNVVQEDRNLEHFTEVVLSEEGDLFVDVDEQTHLVIEAEDNLQECLIADIENGVLDIKKAPDNIQLNTTRPIRYYLTVTTLKSLTLKNSGDAEITTVNADQFQIKISGSGSLHIGTLNATHLDIALTSSGNLSIDNGQVETQDIVLSSSGKYDSANLVSQNASMRLSSSGDAAIHVLENLEVDLSSSGNVYYTGNPSIRNADSSSSGNVIKQP
jgi:hypothetical protein